MFKLRPEVWKILTILTWKTAGINISRQEFVKIESWLLISLKKVTHQINKK